MSGTRKLRQTETQANGNWTMISLAMCALCRPLGVVRRTAVAVLLATAIGTLGFISLANSQTTALTPVQADAVAAYDNALSQFKSILSERRAQIDAKQPLPNMPGQALYLARINVMSTYKDLTDAIPSRIGRPNKFGVPPAYFDAAIEPLIDEYLRLFEDHAGAAGQRAELRHAVQGRCRARHGDRARQGARRRQRGSRRPHQPRHVLRRDQRQAEHRQCPLEHIQGQLADRRIGGSQRAAEMGGDQGRSPRSIRR